MKNELQSSQEYLEPQGIMLDLIKHYLRELQQAAAVRDTARHRRALACIAVLDPVSYREFLVKRLKREK
jgi:molybdopterin-guanine dinucleotide biosynthesis protein